MSNPTPSGDEPKIIIDEDWKSQAHAEKERLERTRQGEPFATEDAAGPQPAAPGSAAPGGAGSARPRRGTLPPPSLGMLATSVATQALMVLGLAFDPSGQPHDEPDFEQARHLIDTLQMLENKTAGNRTPEESEVFSNLLHEVRMAFVSLQSQPSPPSSSE